MMQLIVEDTRPAKPEEYDELLRELNMIYDDLEVVRTAKWVK